MTAVYVRRIVLLLLVEEGFCTLPKVQVILNALSAVELMLTSDMLVEISDGMLSEVLRMFTGSGVVGELLGEYITMQAKVPEWILAVKNYCT